MLAKFAKLTCCEMFIWLGTRSNVLLIELVDDELVDDTLLRCLIATCFLNNDWTETFLDKSTKFKFHVIFRGLWGRSIFFLY